MLCIEGSTSRLDFNVAFDLGLAGQDVTAGFLILR
jgi:hypothetical protein